jgi:hypothetical protein
MAEIVRAMRVSSRPLAPEPLDKIDQEAAARAHAAFAAGVEEILGDLSASIFGGRHVRPRNFVCQGCGRVATVLPPANKIKCSCGTTSSAEILP